jgi:serine/threonine protein kinase
LRFEDTAPEDFCEGAVLFYTAQELEAPAGFQTVWRGVINGRHLRRGEATQEEHAVMSRATAVMLLADLSDSEQMSSVISMGDFVNTNFGDDAPIVIYVPHSVCPELRRTMDLNASLAALKNVFDSGIDEAITGEAEGLRLALEIQNRVCVQASLIQKFNDMLELDTPEEREARVQRKKFLEEVIHDTVWDYLRVRTNDDSMPQIDWSLPRGTPQQIKNYQLGPCLGRGSIGKVYQLRFADGSREPTGSVLKVISKGRLFDLSSLLNVRKQLHVMRLLTQEFPHPNICKLQDVLHSETHLLFQLEDCGSLDLYKFNVECERRHRSLSLAKTRMLIEQLISAVCHMHLNAKVVHRDLKPENIIIKDTRHCVQIKITDFDTSQVDPAVPSYGVVGTFPFSAPEIVLQGEFDPYAADVWSMGLVIVELLCYAQILERLLQFEAQIRRTKREWLDTRQRNMAKIHKFFSQPEAIGCLLRENMRRDLQDLMSHNFFVLLQGMLNVSGSKRVRSRSLVDMLQSGGQGEELERDKN